MARFVIGLIDDGAAAAVATALQREGAVRVDTAALQRIGALLAEFGDDVTPEQRIMRLSALPGVRYAEVVRLRGQLPDLG